jgi:hypothetical protein
MAERQSVAVLQQIRTLFGAGTAAGLDDGQLLIVLSGGRPVEGAHVAGGGKRFRVRGVTGRDGRARLWLPATERVGRLVAWHADLGVTSASETWKPKAASSCQRAQVRLVY